MPFVYGLIWLSYSHDDISVIAIENLSSIEWLRNYVEGRGITYPFIFDEESDIFNTYQVGSQFGNTPPTFIIIDKEGIIRYRTDNEYDTIWDMKSKIEELL